MKLVIYNKNQWYFLSDTQFEQAVEQWNTRNPIYFKKFGFYLPQPKIPAGVPVEHEGLQLGFTYNNDYYGMPGWIALQRPQINPDTNEEVRRGAIYVRVVDHHSETLRYRWKEINPHNPMQGDATDGDFNSEDVYRFFKRLNPTKIDDILDDPEKRRGIPFEPLLPDYNLS